MTTTLQITRTHLWGNVGSCGFDLARGPEQWQGAEGVGSGIAQTSVRLPDALGAWTPAERSLLVALALANASCETPGPVRTVPTPVVPKPDPAYGARSYLPAHPTHGSQPLPHGVRTMPSEPGPSAPRPGPRSAPGSAK